MASKWWKESHCLEKLGNLNTEKALQVLRYCDKITLQNFLRDLKRLLTKTRISGEHLSEFVAAHKPTINLILSGGMQFDNTANESVLFSRGHNLQSSECFLLSVLGREGAWISKLSDVFLDGDSYPLSRDEMLALCLNLSSNANIQSLDLCKQKLLHSTEGCRLLGQALRTNSVLEKLFLPSTNLTSEGVEQLMQGLQTGSMSKLKVLDLGMNDKIGNRGIGQIAKMLETNKNIKILHVRGTGCGYEGVRRFSSALLVNSSLELFSFGANPITEEGMELLLSSLTPVLQYHTNSTVKHLELEHMSPSDFSVISLAMMISSNQTLESLNITGAPIRKQDWIDLVIPALHENTILKFLSISGSKNLPLDAIMKLIVSTRRRISTPRDVIRELKVNLPCGSKLKAQQDFMMRAMRPQLGRIILCGYKFAVALRKSEDLLQGFDVVRLTHDDRRIDVWDFAGLKEYYALHNTLFSNHSSSSFLYVCSVVYHTDRHVQASKQKRFKKIKSREDIQKEFEYWIRFITFSSRSPLTGVAHHVSRPHVILVLTNKDELDKNILYYVSKSAEHVVADMKEKYHSLVDLEDSVVVVDSHSCKDVQALMRLAEESLEASFQQRTESAVCKQVRIALEYKSKKPFLSLVEFRTLCEEELGHLFSATRLHSTQGQVTILDELSIAGDIILLGDHLLVNTRRFVLEVLGLIIDAMRGLRLELDYSKGALKLCDSCLTPGDSWVGIHHERGFVSERQCDESTLTAFTPGFFPKLQVFLYESFITKGWLDNQAFQMNRNLIGFYENGVEVLVEYSGAVGYFVDILVKSSRPFSYTINFVQAHVIQQIRQFCWSFDGGSYGTELVESVIRTLCVKELHLCINRVNQALPVSTLHDRIKQNQWDYKFAWPQNIHSVTSNVEKALDLVGEEISSSSTLSSAREAEDASDKDAADGSPGESSKTLHMESKVQFDPVEMPWLTSKALIQRSRSSIAPYGQEQVPGTSSTREDYTVSSEEHMPCFLYPKFDDVGYVSSLWAKFEAKKAVKIHIMCESPNGSHEVPDQPGRILNLRTGRSTSVEHVLSCIREGLTGIAQIAGLDVDAAWFQGLFGTSFNMPIKIEDLVGIKERCNPSAPASEDEILASLALYLKVERSTQWLKDFLNMENGSSFRYDFNLWKVRNSNTNSVVWVCVQHYIEGLREHLFSIEE
ncbi:hypothetical protein R1flu_023308 [Riccia fluitans]|uniref:Uncharacterized protein n=1 Tax=Riccia fluitans TaxID=41844 RepID=A0ABD1XRR1_9MARC